ncbi:MAG: hypothetical protein ACON44_05780 [Candidatus Puniceispirillaceae bacterium]
MKGLVSVTFGLFWALAAFIGWWVATSGQGWIGLGIMFAVMVVEGIIYNAVTKPKKEKPEKEKNKRNRRRRR